VPKAKPVPNVVAGGKQNLMLEQRLTSDLYHAFLNACRTLFQPRAFATGDDH